MITPYTYQREGIDQISINVNNGILRQIYQLPTGGGKTVTFSALIHRYLEKYPSKRVVILVHREELLKQARKTLYNGFGIMSESVTAKKKTLRKADVYVGMVETAYNRLKKNKDYFGKNVGMLLIDEVHIGNFKKVYDFFENKIIIGFSATPISASKKDPLKNHYQEIVCGPQIQELIEFGSLTQNETFAPKGVNRQRIKVTRGEFDSREMSSQYSKTRHVKNVVKAYDRLCGDKKTLIFNCNIKHSKLVTQAFLDAGYDARHLDGSENVYDRLATLQWFKHTPNAILNNIAVLTTGFDEPSIRNVIVNRATKSLPLWLQMTGRGSRRHTGKDVFRIIDMGGNVFEHEDWSAPIDWKGLFYNPELPRESAGVAPIKMCDECDAIIPAQAIICAFCGHVHERKITYDANPIEFEKLVSKFNIEAIVRDSQESGHKEFKPFFEILNKHCSTLKHRIKLVDEDFAEQSFEYFLRDVKEWCRLTGRPFNNRIKEFSRQQYFKKIKVTVKA